MSQAPRIRIDPSERLIAVGRTGAGKTEWVKSMLGAVNRRYPVVIVDPKALWLGRNPQWAKGREKGTVEKPRLMTRFDKGLAKKRGVQCFQLDAATDLDGLNALCMALLDYGRQVGEIFVYFDETEGVASANKIPAGISKVWKLGRALGVGAWVANQRSLGIPEIFKSQAEAFVIFDVPGGRDRSDLADYTNTPEIADTELSQYEWWWFHRKSMRHAERMRPLNIKKPVKTERVKK